MKAKPAVPQKTSQLPSHCSTACCHWNCAPVYVAEREKVTLWTQALLLVAILALVKGILLGVAITVSQMASLHPPPSAKLGKVAADLAQCTEDYGLLYTMLQKVTEDKKCLLCPSNWRFFWGNCYFFSMENNSNFLSWNASAQFCAEHDAELVVIGDRAEMEFIQASMHIFPTVEFLWVGLTDRSSEGSWIWMDGTPHEHTTLKEVEWNAEDRDCADLRGNADFFAMSCEDQGPFICEKPVFPWTPGKPSRMHHCGEREQRNCEVAQGWDSWGSHR
ncbi:CD209 antigen-like protein E isoform X2 [Lepisosteus oculatus]|uniref:CD209 antigen-like protein E isoform X2 n=1 Tax=Lepisosteus oculatus TaxID=7918 RepID=UPI0037100DA9